MPGKTKDARRKALDKGLKAMFRTLEKRPTPPALSESVDQLEAGRKGQKKKP